MLTSLLFVPLLLTQTGVFGQNQDEVTLQHTAVLGPYTGLICEDLSLVIDCPSGYFTNFLSASYGRYDNQDTCMEDGEIVTLTDGCLDDTSVLESLRSVCTVDQEDCTILVNRELLGDPCPGHANYLNVSYNCQQQVFRGLACEGSSVTLTCFGNDVITVQDVLYGRDNNRTCSHETAILTTQCAHEEAPGWVRDLCTGRSSCTVSVDANAFGDPCEGTFKYMEINFTCSACTNQHGDDADCSQWRDEGFCESNAEWMFAYCRKACTRCDVTDTCNNVVADASCEGWAEANECVLNPDWMPVNCARACNLCSQYQPSTTTAAPTTAAPATTSWAPPTFPDDHELVTTCADSDMLLQCSDGYIRVLDAYYGRTTNAICPQADGTALPLCNTTGSVLPFLLASLLCNGRSSCYLYVDDPPFTDPCPEAKNFLEVRYQCQPCENTANSTDCGVWQTWNECNANRYWMLDNCFETCSYCQTNEDCSNVQADASCDYWTSWGECLNNAEYMSTNCQRSCRLCSGTPPPTFTPRPTTTPVVATTTEPTTPESTTTAEPTSTTEPTPVTIPPTPAGAIRSETCRQFESHLMCTDPGTHIRVLNVFFGRHNLSICPDDLASTTACQANVTVATAKAREVCNGRQTCYLRPLSPPFEDTCPDSSKYLIIDYVCEPCQDSDERCTAWAADDECMINPIWMSENCFRACSGCDSTVACNNSLVSAVADSSCDYWMSYGECVNNTEWMMGHCEKSCRLCTDLGLATTTTPTPESTTTAMPADGLYHGSTCGTLLNLTCPEGQYLQVQSVYYGIMNDTRCPGSGSGDATCRTGSTDGALGIAKSLCDGRYYCNFPSASPPLDTVCAGLSPYTDIDFKCAACENVDSDSSCDSWAEAGYCESNADYMRENCFRSCYQCEVTETCSNDENDITCDFWTTLNQCNENPDYMHLFCRRSCRSCDQMTTTTEATTTTATTTTATTTTMSTTTTPPPTTTPPTTTTPQPGLCGDPGCEHGVCVGVLNCLCDPGYTGSSCSQVTCSEIDNCSGHGTCSGPNTCTCDSGYEGHNCATPSCEGVMNCNGHGTCVSPNVCTCNSGYSGTSCALFSCSMMQDCSGHGSCVGPEQCECQSGYAGPACTDVSCTAASNCSNHGTCVGPNTCVCEAGYAGAICDQLSCANVLDCMNQGECVGPNVCQCHSGYFGQTCAEHSCLDVANCNGHGTCSGPNTCSCYPGYSGPACDQYNCLGVQQCHGQGTCVAPDTCSCHDGYMGMSCDQITCIGVNDCTRRGQCIGPNTCSCEHGYTGPSCSEYSCSAISNCHGQGSCTGPNVCTCNRGYYGSMCESFTCSGVSNCSGHGRCIGGDQCECDEGWTGEDCSLFGDGQRCSGLNSCNGRGICVANNTCWCFPYYSGIDCSQCSINGIGQACVTCPPCQNGYCVQGTDSTETDTFMGCYLDVSNSRDLPIVIWTGSQSAAVRMCIEACYLRGYKYAGLQGGDSCYCGNTYGRHGTTGGCNLPCTNGQMGEMCGGIMANSIYMTYQGMCECDGPNWTGAMCDQCSSGYVGSDCTPIPTTTMPTTTTTTASTVTYRTTSSTSTASMPSSAPTTGREAPRPSTTTVSTTTTESSVHDQNTYEYMNLEALVGVPWRSDYEDMGNHITTALMEDIKATLEQMYRAEHASFTYITMTKISPDPMRVLYYLNLSPAISEEQAVALACTLTETETTGGIQISQTPEMAHVCSQRNSYCEHGGTLLRRADGQFYCRCTPQYSGWRCSHSALDRYLVIIVIVLATAVSAIIVLIVCCCLKGVCNQKPKPKVKKTQTHLLMPNNGTARSFQYHGMAKGMRGTKLVSDQERGISREHADNDGYVPRQI